MLLRRLAEHVRTQNWLAVCLDFFIVVVGVYLGFQITAWNESRQDVQRGEQYLARIRADLIADLDDMDHVSSYWSKVVDYGSAAIAYAETGQLYDGSARQTVLAFFQAGQVEPYITHSTTYLEMRSAGDLGLIENDQLRDALAQYYTAGIDERASHLTRFVPEYREEIRGLMPYAIQEFIWGNCVENAGPHESLVDCTLPVSDEVATSILETFISSATTLQDLRFWISNQVVALKVVESYRNECETLLEQVSAELGRREATQF
jgi:hypothetical protein